MANFTQHRELAPWDDWEERHHGGLDQPGDDDTSPLQQNRDEVSSGGVWHDHGHEDGSWSGGTRNSNAEQHWPAQDTAGRHGHDDARWMIGDERDGLPLGDGQEPMAGAHGFSGGQHRGDSAAAAVHGPETAEPGWLTAREDTEGHAHAAQDASDNDHGGNAVEALDGGNDTQHYGNTEADRDDDGGEDRGHTDLGGGHGEHHAQGGSTEGELGAACANTETASGSGEDGDKTEPANHHHAEHDDPTGADSAATHECGGDARGGNEDQADQPADLAGSAHDGHEAQDAVDARQDDEATEGQAACDDTHHGSDGGAEGEDDDGPNEDPDHTRDAGHGPHHQDDTSEDRHGASCGTTETGQNSDPAGDPVDQTAQHQGDAEDPACAAVAMASAADDGEEHSHRGRERSGNEGTHGHDDELSALLSSDTLVWKEASEWCADTTMSPGTEQPHLADMNSLLEACRDDGINASQPSDDGAFLMHTNALLGMQPDHGLQTL